MHWAIWALAGILLAIISMIAFCCILLGDACERQHDL